MRHQTTPRAHFSPRHYALTGLVRWTNGTHLVVMVEPASGGPGLNPFARDERAPVHLGLRNIHVLACWSPNPFIPIYHVTMNSSLESPLGAVPIVDDRHSIADLIYRRLLRSIEEGELLPGQRIHDQELAESFGFSRTPVREAIHRLKSIGIIDMAANRFTRVAEVSPEKMQNCLVVWTALARALVAEVIPGLKQEDVKLFDREYANFVKSRKKKDPRGTALSVFRFFELFTVRSKNPQLVRANDSVVYLILLGSLALPGWLDVELVQRVLDDVRDGIKTRNVDRAQRGVALLSQLDVTAIANESTTKATA